MLVMRLQSFQKNQEHWKIQATEGQVIVGIAPADVPEETVVDLEPLLLFLQGLGVVSSAAGSLSLKSADLGCTPGPCKNPLWPTDFEVAGMLAGHPVHPAASVRTLYGPHWGPYNP